MRRPRRLRPGTRWFVTVRCARAQFRLRPDDQRVQALGFFLGRALEAHPGVELHAVVQMSNHLHLVVTDASAELDRFMGRFLGPLARALNAVDRVRGQFFERRYAAIEIVDDEALLDRILYTVTNPAAADLVAAVEDWPGLCLWPGGRESDVFSRLRMRATGRAERQADGDHGTLREGERSELARVDVALPELCGRDLRAELRCRVQARLSELAEARGNKGVLGVERVLAQKVFDAPDRPKRSPMPLCHASSIDLWLAFREHWRAFLRAYREASVAFRLGYLNVAFPDWAFRPSVPLLR